MGIVLFPFKKEENSFRCVAFDTYSRHLSASIRTYSNARLNQTMDIDLMIMAKSFNLKHKIIQTILEELNGTV